MHAFETGPTTRVAHMQAQAGAASHSGHIVAHQEAELQGIALARRRLPLPNRNGLAPDTNSADGRCTGRASRRHVWLNWLAVLSCCSHQALQLTDGQQQSCRTYPSCAVLFHSCFSHAAPPAGSSRDSYTCTQHGPSQPISTKQARHGRRPTAGLQFLGRGRVPQPRHCATLCRSST